MTPDRWARIDQLLDEALERPAAERSAFLDGACLDDQELRREVQSLLAAHQNAEEKFLKLPALDLAAKHLAVDKDRSLIGQTISHYAVISVLGVGGMGEVYLARDTKLERKVALKLLPPQYTQDAARIKRFEREARAASALSHPNIITIYEIGEVENRHFIAAEYVDGQTLRELLGEGRVAMKSAIEIAIQIASALAAAHEAGIIHRDIKPENIMLRRDGFIKVLDFGLVKLTEQHNSAGRTNASEDDLAKTNPGAVLGTARYMSPEQALGQEVDQRSDLFSLGTVLYELLAGLPPFKGDRTGAIMDAIVHYREVPITRVRPDLPVELERIVSRALEKDRELRYQTANDLRAELKRLQRAVDSDATGEVPQRPTGQTAPVKKSRLKPIFALGAAAVGLLVLVLAWWQFGAGKKSTPMDWSSAVFSEVTDYVGVKTSPAISPDGQSVVYMRLVNGQWDLFWQRIGGAIPKNLTEGELAEDSTPAFSPDGEWIAFRSERKGGGIYMMGATGENLRLVIGEGYNPSWSPDGQEIAYGTQLGTNIFHRASVGSQIWVINLKTGIKRQIRAGEDAVQPRWSPNGHRFAYWGLRGGSQRDIWTVPVTGGEPVAVTSDQAEDGNPVWSADGRHLYYSSNRNGSLSLWRIEIDERTGQVLGDPELVPAKSSNSMHLSISRDGRRMVYTHRNVKTNIQRLGFNAQRGQTTGEPMWVTQLARRATNHDVSPDGELLTFYTFGDPQYDIYRSKVDGTDVRQLTKDEHKDRAPRWSPTGERIAYFSNPTGKYEIWTMKADGSDRQQLTFSAPEQPGFLDPAWSPDGARMLFSFRGGSSFIMDLSRPFQQQQLFAFPPLPPSFLPAGAANGSAAWFVAYNWSHDSQKIAGTCWTKNDEIPGLVIFDLARQQYERISSEGSAPYWLRDNRRLLYVHQGKICLVDRQTGAIKDVLALANLSLDDPVLSRDERYLYYVVNTNEESIWLITLK